MTLCPHGQQIGVQGGIVADEIAQCDGDEHLEMGLLAFYSACDCCDILMHHSTCGQGYFVMKDGRTLCGPCAEAEPASSFDGASPGRDKRTL